MSGPGIFSDHRFVKNMDVHRKGFSRKRISSLLVIWIFLVKILRFVLYGEGCNHNVKQFYVNLSFIQKAHNKKIKKNIGFLTLEKADQ